jgi:hypothetical protein
MIVFQNLKHPGTPLLCRFLKLGKKLYFTSNFAKLTADFKNKFQKPLFSLIFFQRNVLLLVMATNTLIPKRRPPKTEEK